MVKGSLCLQSKSDIQAKALQIKKQLAMQIEEKNSQRQNIPVAVQPVALQPVAVQEKRVSFVTQETADSKSGFDKSGSSKSGSGNARARSPSPARRKIQKDT